MMIVRDLRGFTLVESCVVALIVGILTYMVYSVWMSNWDIFENHDARISLWEDGNQALDSISASARSAASINVTSPTSVSFLDPSGIPLSIYQITPNGELQVQSGANNPFSTMVSSIDPNNSSFSLIPSRGTLKIDLALTTKAMDRDVSIQATTEVGHR